MNERQPVAFCDADEDCYGDNQCSTLSACPAGVNCCVLAPLGEACPPHFALCAANTQQPRPFCDADPDCYGDSNCCGPFCSGNEACRAGVDCCVTFPTLVAPPVYPPRPPLPKRPPSSPPGAAAFRGFGPRARTGRGGFVFEFGTPVDSEDESFFTLQGDQRAYLARDFKSLKWEDIRYDRLRLLGKTLHVTVNVSGVGCGCNAAIYLVNMPQSNATGSHYCDIQFPDPERCLEIDLLEGNIKGVATTLHTRAGKASDGTCNQWGCGSRWGPDDKQCKFGSGSPNVDSTQPFELLASFDEKGHMKVSIVQKGQVRQLWGVESSGNYPSTAVDEEASLKVKEALMAGMVLVTSLWDAEGNGMAWLDGGCNTAYPHCELDRAIFSISNLESVLTCYYGVKTSRYGVLATCETDAWYISKPAADPVTPYFIPWLSLDTTALDPLSSFYQKLGADIKSWRYGAPQVHAAGSEWIRN
ncbi:MAG: hypothetical protein SGPRY_004814 [Prymnesium sp.]